MITVYDVGEHGDDLFIAMEMVRGASLRTWLASAFLDELMPWRPSGDGHHGCSETGAKRRWLAPAATAVVAIGVAIAFVVTRGPDRDRARYSVQDNDGALLVIDGM
jgi:hypothetical protein